MAKIKYPETDRDKAYLYLHCMLEIKQRTNAINDILASSAIGLFKHETCHLHLRHICEVISIACLVAQGDYKTQRAFTQEYSPPKIFNALRKLYPHFFQQPCTMTSKPIGGGRHEHNLEGNKKPDAFSEADISKLWSDCGSVLHRASVKKYLSTSVGLEPPPLDSIKHYVHRIIRLLETHTISIRTDDKNKGLMLLVTMDDGNKGVVARFLHIDQENSTIEVAQYEATMVVR